MKRIMIILLAAIIPFTAFCQIPKMPNRILSPNAASLGEYGDVPVSPFTGVPQIEVPIHEIKIGDYKLPVYLSYHAGGVRPDQHPGWTGVGWTLMAGGCISRTINDEMDECNNNSCIGCDPRLNARGYLYKYSYIDRSDWNEVSFLKNNAASYESQYDTAPDKFTFNFNGYSGEFYLDEKGGWKVKCDKKVTVIFGNTAGDFTKYYGEPSSFFKTTATDMSQFGASHCFKKFTLITEDGTRYVFGGDDNAIDYSVNFFRQNTERLVATSWYLTKIILPNENEIKFTYERGDFIAQMYLSVNARISYKAQSTQDYWITPMCFSATMPSLNLGYNGQLIAPCYLKYIEGGNTLLILDRQETMELRCDFSAQCLPYVGPSQDDRDMFLPILQYNGKYSGNQNYPNCLNGLKWYKLSRIFVKDSEHNYIRTFAFTYNDNPDQRLMLNTIKESNYSTVGKVYEFEYDNIAMLPPYIANKTDHWGFYNNRYAFYDNLDRYPSYREPNEAVATYGTLTKIKYPTGGYSRFVYEPHDYTKYVSADHYTCNYMGYGMKAGGIRIKEIINSPTGNTADEVTAKKYYYVSDYLQNKDNASRSSGVLGSLAKYTFDYTVYSTDGVLKTQMKIFSSQSVLPGTINACGSHIGYSEVVEKYPDGSFSRYKYTNFDDGHGDNMCEASIQLSHTIYEPYSSKEQERGLLKLKEDYDSSGKLKFRRTIEYVKDSMYGTDKDYVRAVVTGNTQVCSGNDYWYIEGTSYKIYTYSMLNKREITEAYEDAGTPLKTEMLYSYNSDKMMTNITRTSGDDKTYIIRNKYPGNSPYSPASEMKSGHVLSSLMETSQSVLINNTEYPVFKTIYNYTKKGTHNFTISSVEEAKGSNNYEIKVSYLYDSRNNPKLVSPLKGVQTVYIWGLKHEYLLAEIKNSYTMTVENHIGSIESFGESLNPDYDKLDNLRKQLPETEITTYRYKPLIGLTQSTDPKGVKRFYEYDHLNRLIVIKDDKGKVIETYNYNYKK